MTPDLAVSTIVQQIQLAIAPVFLLAGIGAMLNVITHRLARAVDRRRSLTADFRQFAGAERDRAIAELRLIEKRTRASNWSIICCTASALFVCLTVAMLFLTDPRGTAFAGPLAAFFIIAMTLLISGLILFLRELQLAMKALGLRRDFIP